MRTRVLFCGMSQGHGSNVDYLNNLLMKKLLQYKTIYLNIADYAETQEVKYRIAFMLFEAYNIKIV